MTGHDKDPAAARDPADRRGEDAGGAKVTAQHIRLSDLTVSCRIGVTEEERARRQRLRLNVVLEVAHPEPREDRIGEVVSYGPLVAKVREACEEAECRLLETLAGQVAAACFFDARIRAARVRIEKLDRYHDVAAIGCEIEYHRRAD